MAKYSDNVFSLDFPKDVAGDFFAIPLSDASIALAQVICFSNDGTIALTLVYTQNYTKSDYDKMYQTLLERFDDLEASDYNEQSVDFSIDKISCKIQYCAHFPEFEFLSDDQRRFLKVYSQVQKYLDTEELLMPNMLKNIDYHSYSFIIKDLQNIPYTSLFYKELSSSTISNIFVYYISELENMPNFNNTFDYETLTGEVTARLDNDRTLRIIACLAGEPYSDTYTINIQLSGY